jgi:hypothetical protein
MNQDFRENIADIKYELTRIQEEYGRLQGMIEEMGYQFGATGQGMHQDLGQENGWTGSTMPCPETMSGSPGWKPTWGLSPPL